MKCSSAGNTLNYHALTAMHCFWLANHTQGSNWETVKQINFCDKWDNTHGSFDPY